MNSPADTTAGALNAHAAGAEGLTAKNHKSKSISNRHVSPDGKWVSFKAVPGLLQYVPTGSYYARAKVNGKPVRKCLLAEGETEISFTTAKLRLPDVIKQLRKPKAALGTFGEARVRYEASKANNHTLSPTTKLYYQKRIQALLKSWPGLDDMKIESLGERDSTGFKRLPEFESWASRFSAEFDEQNFNNTLLVLRGILEKGGLKREDNPAYEIKRLGVKVEAPTLPEADQFRRILEAIEAGGSRYSRDCADLVRFLAYSGCRISEARRITWADVNFEKNEITVRNAKRSRNSSEAECRQVPLIPEMRQLLERLRLTNPGPADRVCRVGECEKALTAACGMKDGKRLTRMRRGKEVELGIGVERITHHDLRHLFASRCIASGVDIQTISRWLGHSDGGALAMRIYGHLLQSHSQSMAAKVTFSQPAAENIVPMPQAKTA